MKIVLDSNIFVAAFATRGICEAILELCLDQHEMAVSRELLHEVRRNLIKKVKLPEQTADEIIAFIETKSVLVTPAELGQADCRDEEDLKILGTAVAFGSDYLVTGDQDLLILGQIGRIGIGNPSTFARILRDKPA